MFRAGRAIAGTCLVLALGGALNAAVARAGTYEVAICHDPPTGWTAPTDGISFPTSGSYADAGVYGGCANGGYLYATLDGVAAHGPSDFAAWEFTAPPATTIALAQLWRAFYAGPSLPYRSPIDGVETISSSGAASLVAACSQVYGCVSAGTAPSTEFSAANWIGYGSLSDVTAVEGTAACGGGQTCAAGTGALCPELRGDPCIASNHLYAMVVTLEDATAPIAANVSGALVAPGVIAGVAGVSFDATDTGSGLYSAALSVDGVATASTPMSANGGHCAAIDGPGSSGVQSGVLRFGWTVPCALAGSGSLQLDTSALADGAHSVVATVSDAAGNTATVWTGTIHTDNAPQGGVPQIFGDAQQGQTLIAGTGRWSPQPSGYAYQWERCDAGANHCEAIPGATAPAYAVSATDDYRQLAVSVTASNENGSTSAASPGSGVVLDADGYASAPQGPRLTAGSLPAISGSAREGAALSAQTGVWSGGPLTYTYQWQRCDPSGLGCAAIAGALGASYTAVPADDYSRLRVLVSASGPGGTSAAASEPSRVIADAAGATAAPASGSPPGATSLATAGAPPLANGKGACATARLHATIDGSGRVTIATGRSVTLRGALDCGRTPIAHALIEIAIAPAGGSAGARDARIRTAADGSFAYVLGPGASRTITVSYRESAADVAPAVSVRAEVLVAPSISLEISPTHTFNGHTITFSGRVSGGHEPRGGVSLELEYLEGSRWMIYTLVRTNPADGRFLYRYTFKRTTQPITYTFRIASPPSATFGYPFQASVSPARSVHVDP